MTSKKQKKWLSGFRSDMRRRWLVSYLVIFCLPLVAYLLMSFLTLSIIRKQTYNLNEQALNITSIAVDKQVETVEAIAAEIMLNQTLQEIMAVESSTKGEKEYRLFRLQNELSTIVGRTPMIEQVYIYMYDGDYIISDGTKSKLSYFFENECSELVMNGQEWRNILRTPHLKEYRVWETTDRRPTLMLLVSIPLFEGAPRATICIKLSSWKFWQVVEEAKDMALNVYDAQDVQLYFTKGEIQTEPVVLKSSATGWRYEAYIEDAVLQEQEGYVKILFVLGIILVISLGTILIIMNIRRNYNPIRQMITQFEQIFDKRREETEELPYIEDSLKMLVGELQATQGEMREHVQLMNQAYLICFLMGQFPKEVSVTEQLRVLGFDGYTKFCALILETSKSITVKEAEELLSIGKQETCLYFGYGVELNGRVVFVIDADSGDEESREKLHERLLEEYPGAKLAWSAVYEGGRNLHYAYEEAQYILHSVPSRYEGVITLPLIQEEEQGQAQVPTELVGELLKAIQNGEKNRIVELVAAVKDYNVENGQISLARIKVAAAGIYNQILTARNLQNVSFSHMEMLAFHNIQVRARTTEDVIAFLQSALIYEATKDNSSEVSRDEQLVRRMKKYIDEHYGDVLLSVESLCQAFERSSSGVNKAFKDTTGQGPLYYINFRRIQEAKRIFVESEGEMSASDVLKMVGYTNLNTFTRAFKKHEGITPGQFKDTVQQANRHNM